MKRSGDRASSGNRVSGEMLFTAEARRRGESTTAKPTTEAQRHGEKLCNRRITEQKCSDDRSSKGISDHRITGDHPTTQSPNLCHPERAHVDLRETSASRRTPKVMAAVHTASGSSHDAFLPFRRLCQDAWKVLRAVFREVFDESAYERYLLRTNGARSVASYRDFMQERTAAIAKKPRCC